MFKNQLLESFQNNNNNNNCFNSNVDIDSEFDNNTTETTETLNEPIGLTGNTLWSFLGIDKLSNNKQKCIYNCGLNMFECLGSCNDKKKCDYNCSKNGLECTNKCLDIPDPTISSNIGPLITTNSINTITNQHQNTVEMNNQTDIMGYAYDFSKYGPYNEKIWPQHGNYGWSLSKMNENKLNENNKKDIIEVNFDHTLYPIKTEKPFRLFDK